MAERRNRLALQLGAALARAPAGPGHMQAGPAVLAIASAAGRGGWVCGVGARQAALARACLWQQPRTFASRSLPASSDGSEQPPQQPPQPPPGPQGSSSLHESMDKLVDTAVSLVEEGRLQHAIEALQQGIGLLSTSFPDSPELGELHNQAALLLLFAAQHGAAAQHAASALELTQRHFGAQHALTGHRLLRLGTIKFGAGELEEARPLLATCVDMLAKLPGDPGLSEARFYVHLYQVALASSAAEVAAATPELQEQLRHLVASLGPESMIVRLALAAHSRLVGAALDRGLPQGEAAFKQHIALQEAQDPGSAELGLTLYQLATTYYAHDLLPDAGPVLQHAASILRAHHPEDHELLLLCKHRLGMLCAAGRDPRAAAKLLGETHAHYAAQQPDHPLAKEAELGLAMAEIRAPSQRLAAAERADAVATGLRAMRDALEGMAASLGRQHLLVQAGSRHLAQLGAMAS